MLYKTSPQTSLGEFTAFCPRPTSWVQLEILLLREEEGKRERERKGKGKGGKEKGIKGKRGRNKGDISAPSLWLKPKFATGFGSS